MEETFGQKMIGVDFAATDEVSEVKKVYAEVIDGLLEWGQESLDLFFDRELVGASWEGYWNRYSGHHARLAQKHFRNAVHELELAAMFRVKAMTQGQKLGGKEE